MRIMKRIVNGKTYDTSTARKIAERFFGCDECKKVHEILYQTQGGAFFIVSANADDEPAYEFFPLDRDEAKDWMEVGEVEVFGDHPFGWPPEATADDDAALN